MNVNVTYIIQKRHKFNGQSGSSESQKISQICLVKFPLITFCVQHSNSKVQKQQASKLKKNKVEEKVKGM